MTNAARPTLDTLTPDQEARWLRGKFIGYGLNPKGQWEPTEQLPCNHCGELLQVWQNRRESAVECYPCWNQRRDPDAKPLTFKELFPNLQADPDLDPLTR